MYFIDILKALKEQYKDDSIERENGTILLGIDTIPKCKHMLFKPLTHEYIKEYLVKPYSNALPNDYIKLLSYSNGFNLCSEKIEIKGFEFASSLLIVFGLPLTPPFQRTKDMEEPFDIRVEDLCRHDNISKKWLKFGSYYKNKTDSYPYDLFADTETSFVYSCKRNTDNIEEIWKSIDECLCSIYTNLIE